MQAVAVIFIFQALQKPNISSAGGRRFQGVDDLATDVCELSASGGSDVYITVKKELSADASGGSDVYYKGDPAVRDKQIKRFFKHKENWSLIIQKT